MKEVLPTTAHNEDDSNPKVLSIDDVDIDVGDMLGVWVQDPYPVPIWILENAVCIIDICIIYSSYQLYASLAIPNQSAALEVVILLLKHGGEGNSFVVQITTLTPTHTYK